MLIKIKGGVLLHTWINPGNAGVLQRPKEINISKSQGLEKLMYYKKKKYSKYIKYPQCPVHVPCTGGQRKKRKEEPNETESNEIKLKIILISN